MMALMRKFIRNNYLYKLFLWSFLIMMAIGGGLLVNLGQEKQWAIKVYDNMLSEGKFQLMLKAAKKQQEDFRQRGIVFADKNVEKETVSGALSLLLSEHVMDSLSLRVPDELIDQTMQQHLGQLPEYFFKDGQLDVDSFKRYIAPYTIDGFIEDICLEKKNKLLFDIVDQAIYTPKFELALQYNIDFASKKYSVIKLPVSKYLNEAKKNIPTDQQLEKFYKKPSNNESFKTQEKRAATIWKFSQSDYQVAISESEVKSAYENNKQKYQTAPSKVQVRLLLLKSEIGKESETKEKIKSIREKAVENPDSFESLVKEFSQDDSSKNGLTDFFTQDSKEFEPIVVKTAFEALSKDGQISNPIKTNRGYELVQRVKRTPAKFKDLSSVEKEIKNELMTSKFKQRFKQDAARVVNQAKYNPEVLQKFIQKHKGMKQEVKLDTLQSNVVSSHLFKTGENRYSTFFDKGDGVILLCTELVKSQVPALSEVRDEVLEAYYKKEAQELLSQAVKNAMQDAKKIKFEDLSKQLSEKIQVASFDYQDGKLNESPILKEPAIQSKLKGLHHAGTIADAVTDEAGFIIKLDSIENRDENLFDAQQEKLSKTLFYAKKYQVKEAFIASLYRRAKLDNKIHIKNEILQFIDKHKA